MVTGPHMFNFAEISELLIGAGAMIALEQPENLGRCLSELFANQQRREQMGAAGLQLVADNRGAKARLLALVDAQMDARRAS